MGTVLPFTPGFIGTYHAAITYSLLLYQVPLEKAAGVSLVFHASYFLPTTFTGLLYIWHYKLSLKKIKEEVA